jgi:lipoprotein NlpD
MTSRLAILLCGLLLVTSCGGTRWHDTPQTHIVRRGETLSAIAWRYGKNPTDLARWNRLGDGSLIYPGQVIRLTPAGGSRSTAATGSAKKTTSQNSSRPASRPLPEIPAQPAPDWSWPTSGRIDVAFGAKPGSGTGVLINGKLGQRIDAAASGQVVYAGSGLIGYGKLIILKHNETYLSAYGYSESLLVKEGDNIRKGQQIATMGEGPERKPRLHFEIRRNGQPIDPGKFLPRR